LFGIRSIGYISFAVRIVVLEASSRDLVASEHLVVEALERRVLPPVVMLIPSVVSVLRRTLRARLVRVVSIHVGVGVLVSVVPGEVIVAVVVVIVVVIFEVITLFEVVGRISPIVVLFVWLGLLVVVMLGTRGLGPLAVVSGRGRLVVRSIARVLVVRAGRGRLRVGPWRRGSIRRSVLRPGVARRGAVWSVHTSTSSVIIVGRPGIVVLHPSCVMWRSHGGRSPARHPTWRSHWSQWGRRKH